MSDTLLMKALLEEMLSDPDMQDWAPAIRATLNALGPEPRERCIGCGTPVHIIPLCTDCE
jgi:hypothetical protein